MALSAAEEGPEAHTEFARAAAVPVAALAEGVGIPVGAERVVAPDIVAPDTVSPEPAEPEPVEPPQLGWPCDS